jgi:hypothetical protein
MATAAHKKRKTGDNGGSSGGGSGSGFGSSSQPRYEVSVSFADGFNCTVFVSDGTVADLRHAISTASGRTVAKLFDLADEEELQDQQPAVEAVAAGATTLVATEQEANAAIVVGQSLGADCTDAQFKELCQSQAGSVVTSLDTSECLGLTVAVLADIQSLRNLRTLSLENCRGVCKHGAAATLAVLARNMGSLTALNVSRNFLGAEGCVQFAAALAGNTALRRLDACNVSMGVPLSLIDYEAGDENKGVAAFAEALKQNTVLSELDVSSNGLSHAGVNCMVEALEENRALVFVNILGNFINEEHVRDLVRVMEVQPWLKTLCGIRGRTSTLELGGLIGSAILLAHEVKGNSELQELDVSMHSELYDCGTLHLARALETNTALHTVNISSSSIDAMGAKHLAKALRKNTVLTSLDLSNNELTRFVRQQRDFFLDCVLNPLYYTRISLHLPTYLPTHLPTCLPTCLPTSPGSPATTSSTAS